MVKNAPVGDLESIEWTTLVFEKETMEKLVYWIVGVALSQVAKTEMMSALITDKSEWKLSSLLNESDLAMAAFQYVGNYDKWYEIFKNSDNETATTKRANAPGKFGRTKGKGHFESGFTDEGMEFYHKALDFFKALNSHDEFFAVETNVKVEWMKSPMYNSQRKRAEAMENNLARKTKLTVHPEDVPEVNEAFAKMIYGSEDEDGDSASDSEDDSEEEGRNYEDDSEEEDDDDEDNSDME